MCTIAATTGFDRKTVRRYLRNPAQRPRYGPRPKRPIQLDGFKAYVDERLAAGVWNAVVLQRELRELGYRGGYTVLKDYLQPKREAPLVTAVRRLQTPPGRQAQVDWGHLGTLEAAMDAVLGHGDGSSGDYDGQTGKLVQNLLTACYGIVTTTLA